MFPYITVVTFFVACYFYIPNEANDKFVIVGKYEKQKNIKYNDCFINSL